MKAQEYNLTGNEKFSVWYTTLLMMTNAQLDPNSKARIIKMAKTMCAGEDLDMTKMENDDKEELEKFRKKQEELDNYEGCNLEGNGQDNRGLGCVLWRTKKRQ